VATAKRLLIGQVGIDMLAGPSEVLIWAEGSPVARPDFIAADLLAQAEHDSLASAICITDSPELAEAIKKELGKQLASLPRKDIAAESLRRFGAIVLVSAGNDATNDAVNEAVDLINAIAPEHLELMCRDTWEIMSKITSAGAVFMGAYAPEPLGDYYAGPNHVLPTMGTARFASALSVQTFCKKTSIIAASKALATDSAKAVARLARLESLEGHARAAELRIKEQ
jgi:histidinol dehydrogenase